MDAGKGATGGWRDLYERWQGHFTRSKDREEQLLDRFRDPKDPLKVLIVTAKLLTGFDAPILQAMYLDKPLRDHNLLQAICRTNRTYDNKTHGLIVDYLGIFDDVQQALDTAPTARTAVESMMRVNVDAYVHPKKPRGCMIVLSSLVGALFGGMWGFIPGFLKARTGAHEVITTIMLNYIAAQVVFFALRSTFLRAPGSTSPVSKNLTPIADVPLLIDLPGIRLDFGFIVALVMAVIAQRTRFGRYVYMVGGNREAAEYSGLNVKLILGSVMVISAVCAGIGGIGW